jgi:hypothetical protein
MIWDKLLELDLFSKMEKKKAPSACASVQNISDNWRWNQTMLYYKYVHKVPRPAWIAKAECTDSKW